MRIGGLLEREDAVDDGLDTAGVQRVAASDAVLMADYVTADAGTGLVHTAPDHGVDDFNTAHHLGLLQLVGPDGRYTSAINDAEFEGRNIFDANPLVVERLKQIAREQLNMTPEQIAAISIEARLLDALQLDSLAQVVLVTTIEQDFGCTFSLDQWQQLETVRDLVTMIHRRAVEVAQA